MTIQDHYENFMSQPDVEQYVDLYCLILKISQMIGSSFIMVY